MSVKLLTEHHLELEFLSLKGGFTGLSESTLVKMPHCWKSDHIVFRLCHRDPHQLFLRLESQVREFVIEMKVKLLKQLNTGLKTPPQAKKFISLLLDEYAHLCKVARKMSGLLIELVS